MPGRLLSEPAGNPAEYHHALQFPGLLAEHKIISIESTKETIEWTMRDLQLD